MLLKMIYDERLAQASYFIGCQAKGTAIVIDPARDITPYLELAEKEGMSIDFVTETHIHADFVSGTRELAAATGAQILLSDEGDANWKYQFPDEHMSLLHDGDVFKVGNLHFEVLHTPGHTPEHITFALTDTAAADEPIGLFTGDFLFVGDIGRPDLLEEAAGIMGTREAGAKQQFANIERFKAMPDYLQIWPGHGAGSACGKALGAVASSTLGYEKRFNPAFRFEEEVAFVEWLLAGQPEAPRYFAQMKKVNKLGPALLSELPTPELLSGTPSNGIHPQSNLIIDIRNPADFATQHIAGTLNIPLSSEGFATYAGWYVDFEQPTYLIAYDEQLDEALTVLRSIGVDNVPGYYTDDAVEVANASVTQKSARAVYEEQLRILDVRGLSEYQSQHIPGAMHIHMGAVQQHLDEIPRDEALAVQCGSGVRSQIVASVLERAGFTNVVNLEGGIAAWQREGLPLEQN